MSLDVLKKDIASFPEAGRGRWQSFRLRGTASRDPKIYPFNIYLFLFPAVNSFIHLRHSIQKIRDLFTQPQNANGRPFINASRNWSLSSYFD